MKNYRIILIFGIIEILIGSVTLLSTFGSLFFSLDTRSISGFLFIVITACASTSIGVGLLKFNKHAYNLLLYFSSVIILSKFLMFLGIIELNGALETAVPSGIKNLISVAYHFFVIYYLKKEGVVRIFNYQ